MAIGDVYELTYDSTLYAVGCSNRFHFTQLTVDIGSPALGEDRLNQAWTDVVIPLWQAMCTDDWEDLCVRIRKIFPEPTGVQRVFLTAKNMGTILVPDAFPANQVGLISWYAEGAGPKRRGRSFISGFPTDAEEDGTLVDAQRVRMINFATAIVDTQISPSTFDDTFQFRLWSPADEADLDVRHFEPRSNMHKIRGRTQLLCET